MGLMVLSVAILSAWFPPDSFPLSGPLVGAGLLMAAAGLRTLPWAKGYERMVGSTVPFLGLLIVVSAASGWYRTGLIEGVLLCGSAMTLGLAAWQSVDRKQLDHLALFVSLLGCWAVAQVLFGFDASIAVASRLPNGFRELATARLASRRAFAGLALPGHLAVVLVSVLPMLLAGLKAGSRRRWFWGVLVIIDLGGILATRSVMGFFLAILVTFLSWGRLHLTHLAWMAAAALMAITLIVSLRGDLRTLTPLHLRMDNWRTALWVWEQSPLLGVGPGGYGQAAQGIPHPVKSESAYAHNLPLQALAELGPTGFVLSLIFLGWVGRTVRRLWRDDRALALSVAVLPVHSIVDFAILRPGPLLVWSVLAGVAFRESRPSLSVPLGRVGRRVLIYGTLLGLITITFQSVSVLTEEVAEANSDADLAARSVVLAPWRVRPRLTLASIVLQSRERGNRVAEALHAVHGGLRITPRSAAFELTAAQLELVSDDPLQAMVHVRRACHNRPGWKPAQTLWRTLAQEAR